ncbi:hypothetical protein BGX24_000539, partial [Mortierella sp. AD032]
MKLQSRRHYLERPRAEKGERVVGASNTKKSAIHATNEILRRHYEDEEEAVEEDVITLAQEQGHHPLNVVFDYEAFDSGCIIGNYDFSASSNDYYEEAITPTIMQRQHVGENFGKLRKVTVEMIQSNKDDEQATADKPFGKLGARWIRVCMQVAARLKIAYIDADILGEFEDGAQDWLLVCRTFDNLVTTLKLAEERESENPLLA